MLELRGVERRFSSHRTGHQPTGGQGDAPVRARGLLGVDLDVARGEMVALIGPSGAGKSTLLRIIAGLDRPDRGTVRIAGRDVTGLGAPERRVGMSLDDAALYEHLSVRQNLHVGLDRFGLRGTAAEGAVIEAAELTGAIPLLDRLPAGLSAGERRRVSLARAVARRPAVLLLDEPLAHLDQRTRFDIREDLRRIHEATQAATVLVTHDHLDAIAIADRLAYLDEGQVLQTGPVEAFAEPAHVAVALGRSWAPLNVVTGPPPAVPAAASAGSDPTAARVWTATLGTTSGQHRAWGDLERVWTATIGTTSGQDRVWDRMDRLWTVNVGRARGSQADRNAVAAIAFEPGDARVVAIGDGSAPPLRDAAGLAPLGVGTILHRTPVFAPSHPPAEARGGDSARGRTAGWGGRVLLTVHVTCGSGDSDSPPQRVRVEADAATAPPVGADVLLLVDPSRIHRFGRDGRALTPDA